MVLFAPAYEFEQERPLPSASDLPTQVVAIQTNVATLQSQAATTQAQVAATQAQVAVIETKVVALLTQVATIQTSVRTVETDVVLIKTDIGQIRTTQSTAQTSIGEVETQVADLNTKVAELNTWVKIGGSLVTGLVVVTFGYLFTTLSSLNTQVSGIGREVSSLKQSDRDRGYDIVKQIAAPKDPSQFHAAVEAASISLHRAAEIKKVPDPVKVASLSDALAKATSQKDVSDDTWKLASEFVSYRSDAKAGFAPLSLPACSHLTLEKLEASKSSYKTPTLTASHCVLNLNDVDTLAGPHLVNTASVTPPNLLLNGVELRYRDSPERSDLNSFNQITCNSCRYDFESKEAPPPEVKGIIRSLVLADTKKLIVKPQS